MQSDRTMWSLGDAVSTYRDLIVFLIPRLAI